MLRRMRWNSVAAPGGCAGTEAEFIMTASETPAPLLVQLYLDSNKIGDMGAAVLGKACTLTFVCCASRLIMVKARQGCAEGKEARAEGLHSAHYPWCSLISTAIISEMMALHGFQRHFRPTAR